MDIKNVMTKRVVTVDMDDSLRIVKSKFDAVKFHHLFVLHAGKLEGVVSDRDLLREMSPFLESAAENHRDRSTLDRRVHQVMTRNPVTLHESATLDDAVDILTTQHFSCVPIVDDNDRPIGIVTWRDVIKELHNMTTATD